MKKIIAWVNKLDKKNLEKLDIDIYFSSSLKDFENNLDVEVLPLFSLGLAGRTLRKTSEIITSHPELKFYFLDKRTRDWILEDPDWKVRSFDNVEISLLDFQEVALVSNDPPIIPRRILETDLLTHGEA